MSNFTTPTDGMSITRSRYVEQFAEAFPESLTSYDWLIEANTFTRNTRGLRIAADQDHGIRPLSPDAHRGPETRPRDHRLLKNDIQDNRNGIELVVADGTLVEGNLLRGNVEANLRQDDATGTTARSNLGAGGGSL